MDINLTLLGQMGTFLVLVWVTMKYVWPPLMEAMENRRATIAEGLAASERGKKEQEEAEARAAELIKEAREQAGEIIAAAEKRGNQIVEEAKDTAKGEGERILTAARSEIDQEVNRAREGLRAQVAGLTVTGAGKILGREIDDKAHAELLDELVAQL